MSKKVVSFSIALALLVVPLHTHAAYVVFDPVMYAKQGLQYANEIITKGAALSTAAQTYINANKILLEPLANNMIATALLAQQKGTINLVTGGINGNSLLKADPDKWIQDQGLNAVRVNLSDVSSAKGTYSSSILNSLVSSYRGSSDLKTQLQSNSVSSRPSLIQKDVCKDAALTAAATNDVQLTGSSDQNAIKARKTELYNSLCKGNPQTDTALANRLLQVEQKRPDLVGTKSFEAYLSGDNAYARAVQTSLLVAQDKQAKEQSAKEDLNRGGGIVSPSNCAETVAADSNTDLGNIANLPCRMREYTGSSAQLASAYQQALNAPVQKLITAQGTNVLPALQTLLSAKNTFDLMKNAFSFTKTLTGSPNTSVTTASAVKTPDLAGNAAAREAITKPINDRLDKYENSISKLEQNDTLLVSHLDLADSYLENVRSCYQGIVDTYGVSSSDPRVKPGFAYYTAHYLETASLRAQVAQDQTAIQAARAAVANLRDLDQNSNSTEEINTAYSDFESKASDGTYPNDNDSFQREGSIQDIQSKNEQATADDSELTKLKTACSQLSAQLQAEKNANQSQTTGTF